LLVARLQAVEFSLVVRAGDLAVLVPGINRPALILVPAIRIEVVGHDSSL